MLGELQQNNRHPRHSRPTKHHQLNSKHQCTRHGKVKDEKTTSTASKLPKVDAILAATRDVRIEVSKSPVTVCPLRLMKDIEAPNRRDKDDNE